MKGLRFFYLGMATQLLLLALARKLDPGFNMSPAWLCWWGCFHLIWVPLLIWVSK